jgi:hypothetical protein
MASWEIVPDEVRAMIDLRFKLPSLSQRASGPR